MVRSQEPLNIVPPVSENREKLNNVCIITDSIGANMDVKVVEKSLKSKVKVAKAYSTLPNHDENDAVYGSKFPEESVHSVLKLIMKLIC